ncbi:hypothetical protein K9N50_12845, partial [bacterium]|nr:hypothetical protein [bacterium]
MQVVKMRFLLVFCLAFVGFMIAVPALAEVEVEPLNIGIDVNTGDVSVENISIHNLGGDAIDFNVEITVTGEPNEEVANRDDRSEPDDMGYEWRDSDEDDCPAFEWIDIREWDGVQDWTIQDDGNSGAAELGFTFPFWERDFDRVYIDSDGWMSFSYGGQDYDTYSDVPNYPMEAGEGAEHGNTVVTYGMDHTGTTDMWFWTDNDYAVLMWHGNRTNWIEMLIYPNGLAKIQYGENAGQAVNIGVNLGDGDHGWSIQQGVVPQDGDVIAFGPASAWTSWISIEPDAGSIDADGEADLDLTLDATGLIGGDWEADVTIFTTDEEDDQIVVSVTMSVTDAPDIDVVWSEDIGYPDVIDWNDAFDDLFTEEQYDITVNVCNIGTANLSIATIASESEEFWANPDEEIVVEPESEAEITFSFLSAEPGDFEGVMVISSNDPRDEDLEIALHARTASPPQIGFDPDDIEEDLFTGDIEEYPITVSNTGDALLRFMAELEVTHEPGDEERDANVRSLRGAKGVNAPRRDPGDPGELIGSFNGINAANNYCSILGWDPDNEWMWVSNYNNNVAVAYTHDANYEEFEEALRIAPGNCMDGAFLNGHLWLGTWSNATVNRYDANGDNVGSHQFPTNVYGLGADNEESRIFHMTAEGNYPIRVYDVDGLEVGEQIGTITNHMAYHNNCNAYGLDWVPQHGEAPLWMFAYNNGMVYQIGVDQDEWECIDYEDAVSFNGYNGNAGAQYGAVAHDGEFIWCGGYSQSDIRVFEDGVAETRWIAIAPEEGEVESDDEVDVVVYIDCTGLFGGDYIAEITFYSNDPQNEAVVITVTIHVTGAPALAVEWEEDFGYPDVVDWNMAYEDLFSGGPYEIHMTFINSGTDALEIEEIYPDDDANGYFTTDTEDMALDPEVEADVVFTFDAEDAGEYSGNMVVVWNDPNEEDFIIPLSAVASTPPVFVIDPEGVDYTGDNSLYSGAVEEINIIVGNEGDALLRFDAEVEVTHEPGDDERDQNVRSLRGANGVSAPRRDDINVEDVSEMRFAVFQTYNAWGVLADVMLGREQLLTGDNYDSFRDWGALDDIDFDDYNAIIFNLYNEAGGANAYNGNMERIMEFIDGGGGVYCETADQNQALHAPGDFVTNAAGNSNATMVVSPYEEDDNYSYLAEIFHTTQPDFWEQGETIEGSSFLHSSYQMNQFEDALEEGVIEYYQLFAVPVGQQTGGVVCYGIGSGNVITLGHPTGHCWQNYANEGMWGSVCAEILYFLTSSNTRWIALEPVEGEVESDDQTELLLTLDATGLIEGDYNAIITFITNDPAHANVEFPVDMYVIGAPDVDVTWGEDYGYPDVVNWNAFYPDLFSGGPYDFVVNVANIGTDDLEIDEMYIEHDYFSLDIEDAALEIDESFDLTITFEAPGDDPGEYETILYIVSDDPDEEVLEIALYADAMLPPNFDARPGIIEEEMVTGQIEDYVITISNDGDATLRWTAEGEITAEPERDENARTLRGPRRNDASRDDPGELLGEFNGINAANNYCSIVGWDREHEIMWVSNYNNGIAAAYSHDN